ncbi:MAG: pentapeptide repeat-containing protein [Chloroflexota bacterium]
MSATTPVHPEDRPRLSRRLLTLGTTLLVLAAARFGIASAPTAAKKKKKDPCKNPKSGANLDSCNLSYQDLTGKDLSMARMYGTFLSDHRAQDEPTSSFNDANINSVIGRCAIAVAGKFQGASMEYSSFVNANFSGANLREVVANSSSWMGINLAGANLTDAVLNNVDLSGASIDGANFTNASFIAGKFYLSNASNVDFTGVDFQSADITGSVFFGSNFTNADFTDATFSNANLKQATLFGATYDETDLLNGSFRCNTIMSDGSISNTHCAS